MVPEAPVSAEAFEADVAPLILVPLKTAVVSTVFGALAPTEAFAAVVVPLSRVDLEPV